MKTRPIQTLSFKPESRHCALCDHQLVEVGSRRHVRRLAVDNRVNIKTYYCPEPKCELSGVRIKPLEYLRMIYPGSSYGIDVYAEIGRLRLKARQSVPEIYDHLQSNYGGLKITERTVENIVKRFLLCVQVNSQGVAHIEKELAGAGIKELVLSLDGIAPEQGNDILYIIREVRSGQILFGRYLEHSDAPHLKAELLAPFRDLCSQLSYPVLGWICDKQNGFEQAISEVFPDVILQHCQWHFIKALKKPAAKIDSAMAKEIKKSSGA